MASESVCEADGVTLSGGVIDYSGTTCPAGTTLEYSIDGGTNWLTTVVMYDQTTTVTVTVRCLCNEDGVTATPTAEATTVPGVCTPPSGCGIDAGEPTPTTADVCDTDLAAVDVTAVFADAGPAGTPSLNQNYIIVDPTNNNDIISVSNTAVLDLTGLAVGDEACVISVAYTQETLDIVTAFVDAQLGSICVPVVGPCASDFIGPFGTLDLSGFLNGLNGAFETFGFNFTSDDIALWCINQEITLPLSAIPGGLFPDLVIDLTTIPGLEPDGFCCDFATDPYCLTVISCNTVCEADAPTMSIDCTDCGDGTTGGPCTVTDAGDGSANAGEITEYIVIDDAAGTATTTPDGIISVGALTDAQAAVDGLADGEEVCVTAITHVQAELDAVIIAINAALAPLGVDLGLPATGNTLADVFGVIQALAGGATIDLATIEAILANGNGGQVDLGVVLGLPADIVVVDLPPFCYNVDPPVCVTASTCATAVCAADAPTMSIDCTDCGDGTTGGPCTVTDAGDGSANAGEITEYLVIDDAAGTATTTPDGVISVGALADAQAAVDALADGEEVCVTAITHIQTELDAVIAAIEGAIAPLGVSLGLPPTGNTLADVFGAIQVLAGGATVDLATIEGLIGNGAGGTVDLGAVLGLPPDLLTVDIPTFCYNVDPPVCVTANTCTGMCQLEIVITGFSCDPGADPNDPADDMVSFDYTVNDLGGTGTTWSDDQGQAGQAYGTTFTIGPIPADGSTFSITVTDDADPACTITATQTLTDCGTTPADIPTLSEWGLITLALLLMTFGSVKMAVGNVALATTGSRNIPVPGMSNFQLPFDATIFRKSTTLTAVLAMIGFAICFAIFGAIFLPDVIGVLVAGPVFAYLIHLLYILETRKGK